MILALKIFSLVGVLLLIQHLKDRANIKDLPDNFDDLNDREE